jgi:diguanylate cyclase (GGDEF)-like protein
MSIDLKNWLVRINARRYRRTLIACLATVGLSLALLGTVAFMRWRADRAVHGDTTVVLNQAGEQLLRAFQSRRGTLTLLRDTLEKAPALALAERKALANSAVSHTRHLIGIGLIDARQEVQWWQTPSPVSARGRQRLATVIGQRMKLRNAWKVPSTFTVTVDADTPLLVMVEPLRTSSTHRQALVGVFSLKPLLVDFFDLTLQQPFPVQLLEGATLLYRSANWQPTTTERPLPIMQQPLRLGALDWTLQMQPGKTRTVQAMSAFHVLIVTLSLVVGLALTLIIWLLAMRTRILQHIVSRRTAALRRTTERLRQLATTDELTGLHNRRFFLDRWGLEHQRAVRYQRPLACLMIDVNHFKQINDRLGHHIGDLVLRQVAEELTRQLRQSDLIARFGGDEFVIALPETSMERARAVAEKLRQVAFHGAWDTVPGVGPVGLSVGVSYSRPDSSAEQVLHDADMDMYATRQAQRLPSSLASTS